MRQGHEAKSSFHRVETIEMKNNILNICDSRSDDWSDKVRIKVLSCIHLVAEEAINHHECDRRFRLGKPKDLVRRRGRAEDSFKADFFLPTCNWLESSMEVI